MKAIIAGLGGRGFFWLKTCKEEPEVEVVACVEPAAANHARAIKELGIPREKIHPDLNAAINNRHNADCLAYDRAMSTNPAQTPPFHRIFYRPPWIMKTPLRL